MGVYQFSTSQELPISKKEAWEFLSSPNNLKLITPEKMNFEILSDNLEDAVYSGMIISYNVRPLFNIKTNWVTEIKHVEPEKYFVDEQISGPYSLWHHQHHLEEIPDGVLMRDIVTYKPPFWILGDIANFLFIKSMLKNIFAYREKKLLTLFPKN